MNSSTPSVVNLVRRHLLRSTAGKIFVIGALLQLPMVALLGSKAYAAFPDSVSETLAGLALMHFCTLAALFGCWLYYGIFLKFENNVLQNVLLVLVALAPFFPTYAAFSAV